MFTFPSTFCAYFIVTRQHDTRANIIISMTPKIKRRLETYLSREKIAFRYLCIDAAGVVTWCCKVQCASGVIGYCNILLYRHITLQAQQFNQIFVIRIELCTRILQQQKPALETSFRNKYLYDVSIMLKSCCQKYIAIRFLDSRHSIILYYTSRRKYVEVPHTHHA